MNNNKNIGALSKLNLGQTWFKHFVDNENKKWSDYKLKLMMQVEFPDKKDRPSICNVNAMRSYYNKGTEHFVKNRVPDGTENHPVSYAYNETGNKIAKRRRR